MKHRRIGVGLSVVAWFGCGARADMPALTDPIAHERFDRSGFITPFDVSGIPSVDALGSANNVVLLFDIGPFNWITGIGWDVTLETLVPGSQFEHIAMSATHTGGGSGGGFRLTPGGESSGSGGPTTFSSNGEIFKLTDVGISLLFAGPDGLIRLEFFETVDDGIGVTDGLWMNGAIFFQTASPVPAQPTAVVLMASSVFLHSRRRSRRSGLGAA